MNPSDDTAVPTAVILRTERLDLLPIGPEHAEAMAAALADPALYTFTGGKQLPLAGVRGEITVLDFWTFS
ncbi:hypothetical protein [Kitasatospora sp. NPDC059327]|uniref:hypothetical protein n=1 Tax=Kitasatospora sp. NPDC059327 TaxID=3346803 RepID=UPI00367F74E8